MKQEGQGYLNIPIRFIKNDEIRKKAGTSLSPICHYQVKLENKFVVTRVEFGYNPILSFEGNEIPEEISKYILYIIQDMLTDRNIQEGG